MRIDSGANLRRIDLIEWMIRIHDCTMPGNRNIVYDDDTRRTHDVDVLLDVDVVADLDSWGAVIIQYNCLDPGAGPDGRVSANGHEARIHQQKGAVDPAAPPHRAKNAAII